MAVTVTLAFPVKPERAEEFKSLLKQLCPTPGPMTAARAWTYTKTRMTQA